LLGFRPFLISLLGIFSWLCNMYVVLTLNKINIIIKSNNTIIILNILLLYYWSGGWILYRLCLFYPPVERIFLWLWLLFVTVCFLNKNIIIIIYTIYSFIWENDGKYYYRLDVKKIG
jgi:hypothetical protein